MEPARPTLSFAFRINARIGTPQSGGMTLRGERLHIPISGGSVTGPSLSGSILAGGSDWPLIRPDGNSEISARYSIKADDGTLILVENDGLRVSDPEVLARMRNGEIVTPDAYYFRTAPKFEAPAGQHDWLNSRLFVASVAPAAGEIVVDVYVLE